MTTNTTQNGFDAHASCVGLFVAITTTIVAFVPVILPLQQLPTSNWLSLLGLVIAVLCFLGMVVTGARSHLLAVLLGLFSGVSLLPMALRILA